MTGNKSNFIDQAIQDLNNDGIDRRGFLKCMAWAGKPNQSAGKGGDFSFVQISDSHMGFNKSANPDVAATLKAAVDKINGLAAAPEFMLHTGDISHLSKPEEFDAVDQILKSAKPRDVFYVPCQSKPSRC
jgi:3',5'-cyclic-AMP phosphodiesterase